MMKDLPAYLLNHLLHPKKVILSKIIRINWLLPSVVAIDVSFGCASEALVVPGWHIPRRACKCAHTQMCPKCVHQPWHPEVQHTGIKVVILKCKLLP